MIDSNAIIITANERQALYLREHYHRHQASLQKKVFFAPHILTLDRWLESLFENYLIKNLDESRLLINTQQSDRVWETIVKQSPQANHLLHPIEAARLARKAWTQMHDAQAPLTEDFFKTSEDCWVFFQWAQAYQQKLAENHLIDIPLALPILLKQIEKIIPAEINTLFYYGFIELNAKVKSLFAALSAKGLMIQEWQITPCHGRAYQAAFADLEHEFYAMSTWCKKTLLENPGKKIACVIPNLSENRARLYEIFCETFEENQKNHPLENIISPSFNISGGESFAKFPLIASALLLIQWHFQALHIDEFGLLMRSPYFSVFEEIPLRAALISLMKKKKLQWVSVADCISALGKTLQSPTLLSQLQAITQASEEFKNIKSFFSFSKIVMQQLLVAGWPGTRSLDSYDYQCLKHFQKILHQFVSLDVCPIDSDEPILFFNVLKDHCQQITFQAESKNPPIQLLGVLEAAGLSFDAIWFANASTQEWPGKTSRNPFIPSILAEKYHFPHGTPNREYQFCSDIMSLFQQCAPEIIYSYGKMNQEIKQSASQLIRDFPSYPFSLSSESFDEKIFGQHHASVSKHFIDDFQASSVTAMDLPGGAHIFKAMSECAFKAFASHRLQLKKPNENTIGLDRLDRGNIVHTCLEHLWNDIKNHERLLALTPSALEQLIQAKIEKALFNYKTSDLITTVEKTRLLPLLLSWLEIEKTREAFEVLGTEVKKEVFFGEHRFHIKIDRLDKTASGDYLIIDYKTGKCSSGDWNEARMNNPQLPFYALVIDKGNAIAYAKIDRDDLRWIGLSENDLAIPGILLQHKKDQLKWSDKKQTWNIYLKQLLDDFLAGDATRNPKNKSTCQRCDFSSLCRVRTDYLNETDEEYEKTE